MCVCLNISTPCALAYVCVCVSVGSSKIWGFDFTLAEIRVWKAITLNAHHIKTCMSSFFVLSHLRFCPLSNIQ